MERNQFVLQVLLLVNEVRQLTPEELSNETPTVPAWRWGLESALMMAVIDSDYLAAYREGLATVVSNEVTPTVLSSIPFETLPVAEILQFGLMRPVVTDRKLAELALSEPALTKLHAAWDETIEERATDPEEWLRKGGPSNIWDHVQFGWGRFVPEVPDDENDPLNKSTKSFLERVRSGTLR